MKNFTPATSVKSKKREKIKNPSNIRAAETWRDFCDDTTIQGLRYVWGTKAPSSGFVCRLTWASIWFGSFLACVTLCVNYTWKYFQFDISTAVDFVVNEEIDFPAITICNQNPYKRSAVGRSYQFMKVLATFESLTDEKDDLEKLALENWEYCQTNYTSRLTELLEKGDDYWRENGFVETMHKLSVDYEQSMLAVWFNSLGTTTDSLRSVLQHAIGRGICSTYNIGDVYVETFARNDSFVPSFGYTTYDLPYIPNRMKLTNANIHTGLRILLDARQDEYCGIVSRYSGAGFKAIVHEPNDFPFFAIQPALYFGPGADYNVLIKPIKIVRKTAHLKRCFAEFNLSMLPETMQKSARFRNQCYYHCFVKEVKFRCGCVPPSIYYDKTNKDFNNFCWNHSMICMNRVEDYFVHTSMSELCHACKTPCSETMFEFEISKMLMPSDNLLDSYKDELWIKSYFGDTHHEWKNDRVIAGKYFMSYNDTEQFTRNILAVNFHFETMHVKTMTEQQAFTALDLFSYFGCNLTLFLGMSVLSVAEILNHLSGRIDQFFRRKMNWRKPSVYATYFSKENTVSFYRKDLVR